jgi:hypothetical protein
VNAVTQRGVSHFLSARPSRHLRPERHLRIFIVLFVNRLYRMTVTQNLDRRHDGFQTVASFASEFRRWLHNRRFVSR